MQGTQKFSIDAVGHLKSTRDAGFASAVVLIVSVILNRIDFEFTLDEQTLILGAATLIGTYLVAVFNRWQREDGGKGVEELDS